MNGSVFEGERAYKGQIFKKSQHHQRLHDSAGMLGFKVTYSVAELDGEQLKMFLTRMTQKCLCTPCRMTWS